MISPNCCVESEQEQDSSNSTIKTLRSRQCKETEHIMSTESCSGFSSQHCPNTTRRCSQSIGGPCSTGFIFILAAMFHSSSWAMFANNCEGQSRLRLSRSAPPELNNRARASCIPKGDCNEMLTHASAFAIDRSSSDDSIRGSISPSISVSGYHPLFDGDDDSEPWDFGAGARMLRHPRLAPPAPTEEKQVLRCGGVGSGNNRHPFRVPKLSRTVETN
mmetsp:Transcript_320/g.685  ORF Transcript_320/g.685 Transcript_320/m.685 type:complete len:218 (+) Transcript_320:203-856(+)